MYSQTDEIGCNILSGNVRECKMEDALISLDTSSIIMLMHNRSVGVIAARRTNPCEAEGIRIQVFLSVHQSPKEPPPQLRFRFETHGAYEYVSIVKWGVFITFEPLGGYLRGL